MAHIKRIAVGYGKEKYWVVRPNAGAHKLDESIPLLVLIRDVLGYADTARESKKIVNEGLVLVDKQPRLECSYGVGLMDVVEIPKLKKFFRVMASPKGLVLKEISEKESHVKLCKIVGKTILQKGLTQLHLHDGTNMTVDKDECKVNDTLVIDLTTRKISGTIEFAKGNIGLVVRGRNSGVSDKITEVVSGTATRKSLTKLGNVHTLTEYVFVVGKDKPLVPT